MRAAFSSALPGDDKGTSARSDTPSIRLKAASGGLAETVIGTARPILGCVLCRDWLSPRDPAQADGHASAASCLRASASKVAESEESGTNALFPPCLPQHQLCGKLLVERSGASVWWFGPADSPLLRCTAAVSSERAMSAMSPDWTLAPHLSADTSTSPGRLKRCARAAWSLKQPSSIQLALEESVGTV